MIPFEGLLPYALIFSFFCIAGATTNAGVTASITRSAKAPNLEKRWSSPDEGEVTHYSKPRHNTDQWDKYFAVRDLRLTGSFRGQSDDPVADESFRTNSIQPYNNTIRPWVLRRHLIMKNSPTKWLRKYNNNRDLGIQESKEQYIRGMGNDA